MRPGAFRKRSSDAGGPVPSTRSATAHPRGRRPLPPARDASIIASPFPSRTAMPVRLALFGAPAIEHDGESHALPFERRGQLVAFLAMKREWVPRAELAALLWPGQESKLAYTNLRKTLFRLQGLPRLPAVETQGSSLRFAVPTDVAAFEEALREERVAEALAAAPRPAARRLRRRRQRGLDRLAALRARPAADRVARRGPGAARGRARSARGGCALVAPARGRPARRRGPAGASRVARAERAGRRAHGRPTASSRNGWTTTSASRPSADLKALHDALSAPGASIAARDEPRAMDGGFVGRSVELRRIAEMLARAECRLLCLLGPGGVGKTRLAQRAMQDLAPRFAGGIGFVALEDVRLPRDIGARIATALGVAPAARETPMDAVVGHLRELAFLLVLDNFEHLASDASAIEQLLAACPGLRIIVTSRVRLALPSEWVLPLEGLPCPEEEDADRLEAFDAARLFVQAARRVQPALAPAAEASAIIDICHQVEGLPLALQLAAGWTRVLSCEAIADELRRGTDLLQAADGTRGERHASFDVVFEQSWRLLTASERDVLSRLSVFRGTIAPDAARSVAGASLPVLGALVDKSLLRKEGTRLRDAPAGPAARRREARRRARPPHEGRPRDALPQRARAACRQDGGRRPRDAARRSTPTSRTAARPGSRPPPTTRSSALMRAAPALHDYFDHRARFDDGLALVPRGARSAARAHEPGRARAAAGHRRAPRVPARPLPAGRGHRPGGAVGSALRRRHRTLPRARRARQLRDGHGPPAGGRRALRGGAGDRPRRRAGPRSRLVAREPGAGAQAPGTLRRVALAVARCALAAPAQRRHRRASRCASATWARSRCSWARTEAAAKHLDEALVLSERAGLASTRAFVLANMTELAMNARDDARARQLAERALEVADGAGIRPLASWLKVQLARLAIRRGDLDQRARRASRRPPISRWPSPRPFPRRRRSWRSRSSWRPRGTRPSGGACSPSACSSRSCPRPRATSCARRGRPAAWSRARRPAGPISRWTSCCNASWPKRSSTHAPLRAALTATA